MAARAFTAPAAAEWLAERALRMMDVGAKETLAAPEGFDVLEDRLYGAAKAAFLTGEL